MQSNDVTQWVLTLDAGIRFLGKVVDDTTPGVFVLNPSFEYLTQIKFVRGAPPQREEAIVALDMVGKVPLTVRPKAFVRAKDLPEWRQRELWLLIEDGLKSAETHASRKRSGIVLPGT